MVLSVGFYRSDHAAVFDLSMDSDDDVLLDWEAYAGAPSTGRYICQRHVPRACPVPGDCHWGAVPSGVTEAVAREPVVVRSPSRGFNILVSMISSGHADDAGVVGAHARLRG